LKYIKKDNRVEKINDADLDEAKKRGWVEIDPDTGQPIDAKATDNVAVLKAEVERLQREVTQLTSELKLAQEAIEALNKENLALKSAQVSSVGTDAAETSPDVVTTAGETQTQGTASKPAHKA
jgi:cell division protein FtsB